MSSDSKTNTTPRDLPGFSENNSQVRLADVRKNPEFAMLVKKADAALEVIGYTEHGARHTGVAAKRAREVMLAIGTPERRAELAAIAAYVHDIGNLINRGYHAQTAAVLSFPILQKMGMPLDEICDIIAAVGNHDEHDGVPVNDLCAAVILADKSDVHRSRVRTTEYVSDDIHDRVNYAVTQSKLAVNEKAKVIGLFLSIDTEISSVMEYFEIFLSRMVVCRRAAEFLGYRFTLEINGQRLS